MTLSVDVASHRTTARFVRPAANDVTRLSHWRHDMERAQVTDWFPSFMTKMSHGEVASPSANVNLEAQEPEAIRMPPRPDPRLGRPDGSDVSSEGRLVSQPMNVHSNGLRSSEARPGGGQPAPLLGLDGPHGLPSVAPSGAGGGHRSFVPPAAGLQLPMLPAVPLPLGDVRCSRLDSAGNVQQITEIPESVPLRGGLPGPASLAVAGSAARIGIRQVGHVDGSERIPTLPRNEQSCPPKVAGIRVTARWIGKDLEVWLGADANQFISTGEIMVVLQRRVAEAGGRLAMLTINGRQLDLAQRNGCGMPPESGEARDGN